MIIEEIKQLVLLMYNVRVAVWQVECQVILINTSVPGVSERIC